MPYPSEGGQNKTPGNLVRVLGWHGRSFWGQVCLLTGPVQGNCLWPPAQLSARQRRIVWTPIYNEKKSQFEIKRNNPKDLVDRVARDIAKLLNSKRKSLEEIRYRADGDCERLRESSDRTLCGDSRSVLDRINQSDCVGRRLLLTVETKTTQPAVVFGWLGCTLPSLLVRVRELQCGCPFNLGRREVDACLSDAPDRMCSQPCRKWSLGHKTSDQPQQMTMPPPRAAQRVTAASDSSTWSHLSVPVRCHSVAGGREAQAIFSPGSSFPTAPTTTTTTTTTPHLFPPNPSLHITLTSAS
ncbi:hypothetical protein EYF80_005851 [Liparis tanakae]|uniref:Uncharacterized protein n=1 Tax=Liparis tanakae TaxID=230148 RepID=A0A4Z2J130_9TELE|nr:hypothetical protein EYF80_005851 [Liparis tanakae]